MATYAYEMINLGGGISGTSFLMAAAKYSDVNRIGFIERFGRVATVNSHPLNNAQTSHDGSTETNYSLAHALEVQEAAEMLRHYVELRGTSHPRLFRKTNRMVLGIGAREVALLTNRFNEFKPHYPDLRLIGPRDIQEIEPNVMEGRDWREPVCALVSDQGYAVNYQIASECFLEDALATKKDIATFFDTKIVNIRREIGLFILESEHDRFVARVLVVNAGPYSLFFAQQLGYATHLGILPVAGSFYSGGGYLRGKVYRVQIEGMPFAAIHGDPDVLDPTVTRFGPTTKPLPLMIRHNYGTFRDFEKLSQFSFAGLGAFAKIIWNKQLMGYVLKNWIYDTPVLGKALFLREARAIVPTIRYRDLKLRRGVGGIRPQVFDITTGELKMGDSSIVQDYCIFNTTPSPGASVCLFNARRDVERASKFLGLRFDRERFEHDMGLLAKAA